MVKLTASLSQQVCHRCINYVTCKVSSEKTNKENQDKMQLDKGDQFMQTEF